MAKRGRKPKATDYKQVLARATKELADKKKALVRAERALANARQAHEELIAEIARLDMAERSLRAIVEGTEPPTNVRYIYQYPQWIWYPSPYVQYTIPHYQYGQTMMGAQSGNIANWSGTVVQTVPQTNSFTFNNSNLPAITTTTASASSGMFNGNVTFDATAVSGICNTSTVACNTLNLSTPVYTTTLSGLTIDLTTHAEAVEIETPKAVGETA